MIIHATFVVIIKTWNEARKFSLFFSSPSSSSFILNKTDRIIVCSFVRPSLRAYGNILALSTFSEPLNKQKKKRKIIIFPHWKFLRGREKKQNRRMRSSDGKKITTTITKNTSRGKESFIMVESSNLNG